MKNRDISTVDFLEALQKEFICLEIRNKIYVTNDDKLYFKSLMLRKEGAIRKISIRNRIDNIFDNPHDYVRIWHLIVPEYGLPKFIYNLSPNVDMAFPFSGTVLKIDVGGVRLYGICRNVEGKMVHVFVDGELQTFMMEQVTRLSPEDTDRFFYYYVNSDVRVSGIQQFKKILHYNFEERTVKIGFVNGEELTLPEDQISRML